MKMASTNTQLLGAGALIFAAMQYGMIGIISRYVGYSLPLFYQNWTRCLVAVLLVSFAFKQWKKVKSDDWIWFGFRSVIYIISFLTFFFAVNILPVNLTYFIFYGGAVIAGYILGHFMFREKITTMSICCLFLAMLGLTLVYKVSITTENTLYVLLAIVSGVTFQLWNTIAKKISDYPATQMTFVDNIFQFIIYFVLSILFKESWPLTAFSLIQATSLLIGVSFATTGLLVVYGFRKIDVQVGSLVLLSEILFALLYSYLFYKEIPTFTAIIGGVMIIIAMALPEIHAYAYQRKTNR